MQVEAAFRRLDLNGDGFIAWDEFQKVFLYLFLSLSRIEHDIQNLVP